MFNGLEMGRLCFAGGRVSGQRATDRSATSSRAIGEDMSGTPAQNSML